MLTGRGGNYIIVDDPLKADDTHSETEHDRVFNWFDGTLHQRTDDALKACFIVVMQRLHQGDLAGRLLERGGWSQLSLPAIATDDEQVPTGHDRYYQRREGRALFPTWQPLELLKQRQAESPLVFAAQYQQEPVPVTGNYVDPAWFRFYDEAPDQGQTIMSMDTASKTGLSNDFTVAITARYFNGRFYILDVHRERVNFVQLWALVPALCRRYGVTKLLIEDASSGQQLLQRLWAEIPPGVPLPISRKATLEKAVRFHAQASRIEAGEVLLPTRAIWVADFIKEIAAFPNGRHDDQADALAQMLGSQGHFVEGDECFGTPIIVEGGGYEDWEYY